MKEVITTFILLFIICTPEPTFSQNSLQDPIKQFQDIRKQLNYISQDLLIITKASSNPDRQYFLSMTTNAITSSEDIIANTVDLIFLFPAIKDEHKIESFKYVQFRLSELKRLMEFQIGSIQIGYAGIKNQAALHLIDKAKDQMRASLSLFDKSIEALKLNKITKTKK